MPRRLPTLLAAAVLPAALVLSGCAPRAEPVRTDVPRPVRTVVVQPTVATVAIELPGEARPRIESRLGFRVGGKIAERSVSVGDRVVPGQVLARLDPTDLAPALQAQQAQLTAARVDRDLAVVDLDRLRNLRAQNYISQAALDRQQATHDAAVSRVAAAEAQLQQARNAVDFQVLRADAAGVVTAVEAEPGQVVAAGQAVVRIARAGEAEIAVNVPESALAVARATREWTVVVPALGARTLPARLRELSPIADPSSRTYPARLAVSGDTAGLALGMTAVVQALRPAEPAFVVPLSALHSKDAAPRVWRVDEATMTVQPVEVRTAGLLDDAVRIVEGLRPGDRIVTAGANLLLPGQKVRLLDAAPTARAAPAAAPGAAR